MHGESRHGTDATDGGSLQASSRTSGTGTKSGKPRGRPKKSQAESEVDVKTWTADILITLNELIFWQQVNAYIATGRNGEFGDFVINIERVYRSQVDG